MNTGIYKVLFPDNRGTYAFVDTNRQVFNTRSDRLLNTVRRGITIPSQDAVRFNNRIQIKLGDVDFLDAFLSIYFRDVLKPMGCTIVEVDEQGQQIDSSGLRGSFNRLNLS